MKETKLLCDSMLGRLARWLRFMGYDTLYHRDLPSLKVYLLSLREGRLFITRNKKFKGKKNVIYIVSEKLDDQIEEVKKLLKPSKEALRRCSVCNSLLEKVDKEKLKFRVPPYIYLSHDEFYLCRVCNKVYWRGSHVTRIEEKVGLTKS